MPIDLPDLLAATFLAAADWDPELPSTNSFALANADANSPLPWLIGADRQQQGRGRGKNSWWTDTGGLTFSVVVEPDQFGLPVAAWPKMSLAVGLAVHRVLSDTQPDFDVRVKWPNDVYVNDRKLCGILIETVASRVDCVVIGIGLNVNNSLARAPLEIQAQASSLIDLTQCHQDRQELLIAIINSLEEHLDELARNDIPLFNRWREACFLTGKSVTITSGEQSLVGTCLGIDDDGALRVMGEAGEARFFAGTVAFGN